MAGVWCRPMYHRLHPLGVHEWNAFKAKEGDEARKDEEGRKVVV